MNETVRYLILALLTLLPTWACSCFNSATPCSVLGGGSVIFVAEVVTDSGEGWGTGPAKVTIVEALKNVPANLKETTIATMSGTSCYFRLRAGERYVIITGESNYSVGGCTSSFRLKGNEHILDAMRNQLKGGPSRLVGTVNTRTGRYSYGEGIASAKVVVEGNGSQRAAMTDGEGHYELRALEPGVYRIHVAKAGYVADDEFNRREPVTLRAPGAEAVVTAPGEVAVRANSCGIKDLAMWAEGAIRGVVRGNDGQPVAGVTVQAFGFDSRNTRESRALTTAKTGDDGRYVLHPLPAGRYVIGVNAETYNDSSPYPPSHYAEGKEVQVGEGEAVGGIDLSLGSKRSPAKLRVKVTGPDGESCPGATVRLDNAAGVQRWFSHERTDLKGEVVADVYVGERYTVRAFAVGVRAANALLEGRTQVDVADQNAAVTVVLHAIK